MRERPISDLVEGLRQLGADVRCVLDTSCPPVGINAKGGLPGGTVCCFHIIYLSLMGFSLFLLLMELLRLCLRLFKFL